MDISAVSDFITTVGFPIVACVFLYRQGIKRDEKEEKHNDRFAELLSDHKIALQELSALNRAELANQDHLKSNISEIRDTLIKVESRPCQKWGQKK